MINDGPSLSIVVAIRNGGDHLESFEQSMGSVTGRGIELVIIDDASTDATSEILKSWQRRVASNGATGLQMQTKRLETPAGVARARKIGAKLATRKWLWFVDVDDGFTSDWLTTVIRLTQENAAADILCARATLLHRGRKMRLAEYSRISHRHEDSKCPPPILLVLEGQVLGYLWDKLIRRDWLLSHYHELLDLRTHSDLYWTLCLFSQSPAVHMSSEVLYQYKLDHGSLSFKPEASTTDFLACANLAERLASEAEGLTSGLKLFLGRFIGLAALDDLIQKKIAWRGLAQADQIRTYLTLTSVYRAFFLRPGVDGLRMAVAYMHPILYVSTGRSARALIHSLRRMGRNRSMEYTSDLLQKGVLEDGV